MASVSDKDLLYAGMPPEDGALLDRLTIGRHVWEDFAVREYLDTYIAQGGSQVKLVIGRPGAGKSHLLRRLHTSALDRGYVVAHFTAPAVRLQRIDHVYRAIVQHIDLEELTARLANMVVLHMGYDPDQIPREEGFLEWTARHERMPEVVRRQVHEYLEGFFKQREFATSLGLAFVQLAAGQLGVIQQSPEARATLYGWIRGEPLKAAQLRPLLISRAIDRYSARDMLDSLSRLTRELGFNGLVVLVDQVEDLLARNPETGRWKYTRGALNDVYQSLREFIDSTPALTGVWIVLAGRRELLDDARRGVRSYDALWLRLQHEATVPNRFNRFSQIVDLDKGAQLLLTREQLYELHGKVQQAIAGSATGMEMPGEVLSPYGETGQYRKVVSYAANVGLSQVSW